MDKEQMKRDVVNELYWDARVDASQVTVEVTDSTVRLGGAVPSMAGRNAAEEDARGIAGVVGVVNAIVVKRPSTDREAADEVLQQRVSDLPTWDAEIDATRVYVTVRAGMARISGSVDSYWRKRHAEQRAAQVDGITSVVNELAVVPGAAISDIAITEDILSALRRKAVARTDLRLHDIDIEAHNGVVTISGHAPSASTYELISETVERTAGVTDVINTVLITPVTL